MFTLALVPNEVISLFRSAYHADASPALFRAPGRVNLIGEHTDYNLGFVFPVALKMACYVAIAPATHGQLRIYSQEVDQEFVVDLETLPGARPMGDWTDYVVGVAQALAKAGMPISSADLAIASDVPTGAGLSSSAALEIATAFALLNGRPMAPLEIAQLGQRAETQFVGMPCGIMDQYAAVFGKVGTAIQIDCRSLEHEYVPLPANVRILAVNSMVKHSLGTSAYRDRVAECAAAVAAIQVFDHTVQSLRDVSPSFFEEIEENIPPIPRRRAHHVISDSQRVLSFADAARASDLQEMGRLFLASHRSMQYDYEISCDEIDFLVDSAMKIPGVYGARMTGGGFGGCTVNLVAPEAVILFRDKLSAAYKDRFGIDLSLYDCEPAEGAGPVS
jgi:galactokinase